MLKCLTAHQNKMLNTTSDRIIQHNYSDPVHYNYIVESLGGEDYLKEKYPLCYKMISDSKELHLMATQNGNHSVLTEKDGFQDDVSVDCIDFDTENVISVSKADFIEDKPIIAISAKLIDKSNDRLEDVINVYGEDDISRFKGMLQKKTSELITSEDREFKVVADFHWMNENENGQPVYASATAQLDDLKIYGSNTIVSNFSVLDPIAKKNPSRDHVVVVYNREAQVGDDYDYAFNNNKQGDYVKIFLPVSGKVTVNSEFEVISLNKDLGYRLFIEDLNKGVVFYYSGVDTVTHSISGDKKSITWRFLDDWSNKLNVKNFGARTQVNIYNKMGIDVKHIKTGMPMTIPVVFQSNGSHSEDKSSILSKPILIVWGCLSKNTKVMMYDKSYREVNQLKVGDIVMNDKMEGIKIKDIYTGPEEQLISIQTQQGKNVCLSDSHPVCTKRGMIAAANLTAADILLTIDGEESISILNTITYNDTVYNLAFDHASTIICDGIFLGDSDHQNTLDSIDDSQKLVVRSEATKKAREEFKKMFDELAERNSL